MRVRLLPTGKAELLGLAACLRSLFPDHDFETVPLRREPDGTRVPHNGFTSARLDTSLVPGRLDKLVAALAAEAHPGRGGDPADLVILLDDLELVNADQPEVVVGRVRQAVRKHLSRLQDRRPAATVRKVERALRERVSFHLAVPMMEAWFFADPEVLPAAGVPAERQPKLCAGGGARPAGS